MAMKPRAMTKKKKPAMARGGKATADKTKMARGGTTKKNTMMRGGGMTKKK